MNLNTIHYDHYDHYDTMVEVSSVSSGCDRKWSSGLCKHPALAYVLLVTSSERIQIFALRQEEKEEPWQDKYQTTWNKGFSNMFKHVQTIQTEAFFQHTDFLSGSETELASHRASRTGCFRFIVQVKIVNNACEDLWSLIQILYQSLPIDTNHCNILQLVFQCVESLRSLTEEASQEWTWYDVIRRCVCASTNVHPIEHRTLQLTEKIHCTPILPSLHIIIISLSYHYILAHLSKFVITYQYCQYCQNLSSNPGTAIPYSTQTGTSWSRWAV